MYISPLLKPIILSMKSTFSLMFLFSLHLESPFHSFDRVLAYEVILNFALRWTSILVLIIPIITFMVKNKTISANFFTFGIIDLVASFAHTFSIWIQSKVFDWITKFAQNDLIYSLGSSTVGVINAIWTDLIQMRKTFAFSIRI